MTPVDDAVEAGLGGRLVVMPTDTVYGIGSRADDPAATSAIFAAKGRARDLELPVLAASLDAVEAIAHVDARAGALAGRFWPGALTMILGRTAVSAAWDLGGDGRTIGVRVPRHPLALAVLERTGPMAVTSANRSGEPPATTCAELADAFGDAVAVYLCEDAPLVGRASTVVDLTGGSPSFVRVASIAETDVLAVLADRALEGPV
jgi:L-threonylcarbamoyladenylate synthase